MMFELLVVMALLSGPKTHGELPEYIDAKFAAVEFVEGRERLGGLWLRHLGLNSTWDGHWAFVQVEGSKLASVRRLGKSKLVAGVYPLSRKWMAFVDRKK